MTLAQCELSERAVRLKLIDSRRKELSTIRIPFSDLVIGSIQNDIPLLAKEKVVARQQGYIGRIQFDLKISQFVCFDVRVSAVNCEFRRELEVRSVYARGPSTATACTRSTTQADP